MTRVRALGGRTFDALRSRDYRLYFAGQVVSLSGTWMQTVAQSWLVIELTGSGALLGAVVAVQFLPLLLLGPLAGAVADRVDKRRFLLVTQSVAGSAALVLGLLVLTGRIELWMVFAAAGVLGVANAFDVPTRQALVVELVGPERLPNALALNGLVLSSAKVVGPTLAGIVIGTLGVAACFLLNAASYLACLAALVAMHVRPVPADGTARGRRRSGRRDAGGLAAIWRSPELRTPLVVLAVIGTITYEFQVTLPLLARFTFGAGAEGYALLLAAMSIGAVVGGLVAAATNRGSHRRLGFAGLALGTVTLVLAAAPSMAVALAVLPFVGMASALFLAGSNATVQAVVPHALRGRVMALYAMALLGTTPIGGPIAGLLGERFGPRVAIAIGGLAAVVAVAVAWRALDRAEHGRAADADEPLAPVVALRAPSDAGDVEVRLAG